MRVLYPDIWTYPSKHPYSQNLIQLFWFSFWLLLGLNVLERPVLAATLASKADFSEVAIAFSETPSSTSALEKSRISSEKSSLTDADEIDKVDEVENAEPSTPVWHTPMASDEIAEVSQSPDISTETATAEETNTIVPIALETEPIPIEGSNFQLETISEAASDLSITAFEFQGPVIVQTQISQAENDTPAQPTEPLQNYQPLLEFQAVSIFQDDDFSGRLRTTAIYAINEQVLFGATVDLTTGEAFVDSEEGGLSLNELYVAAAPIQDLPNLRFIGGLIDLTSYFDRNSFAKDAATHFFNPVFQTNPALSAAGITSRPGLLVNWNATDYLELKAAAFSSTRSLGDFSIDGFAAELGFRVDNLIVRGTYATARDAGENDGFGEIFQFLRSDGSFGLEEDDREAAYGINAEYFIDSLNLGFFGRYGWYQNQDLDEGGSTFSIGLNALDVFMDRDRLGLAYGRQLSNSDLRTGKRPDVWEVFYDAQIVNGIRAGVSLQSRDELSDTTLGFRLRADW
ncbi:MAG: carbohydrate porin [Leptolyngbya sp. SIO1D8]|nr:carbohydrate porin [Leptolyngbya sp. SIO1D8]